MCILSPNSGATAINPYWPIWSIETVPALTKPIAQIRAQKEMVISQGLARYPPPAPPGKGPVSKHSRCHGTDLHFHYSP